MKKIVRLAEGSAVPDFHRVAQLLATEEVLIGTGTNSHRVYTVVLEDERYWLTDEEKLARDRE